MRRSEIGRRVNEMVFDCYDHRDGTLDIVVPLMAERYAFITKEQGESPECVICDDGVEGDGELSFPNVCAFIEKVVDGCVRDIQGQSGFDGYVDDVPDTFRGDYQPKFTLKGTRDSWREKRKGDDMGITGKLRMAARLGRRGSAGRMARWRARLREFWGKLLMALDGMPARRAYQGAGDVAASLDGTRGVARACLLGDGK